MCDKENCETQPSVENKVIFFYSASFLIFLLCQFESRKKTGLVRELSTIWFCGIH